MLAARAPCGRQSLRDSVAFASLRLEPYCLSTAGSNGEFIPLGRLSVFALLCTCGGEGGIRTRGTVLAHTRFPSERLKPLSHLSELLTLSYRPTRTLVAHQDRCLAR